MRSLLVVSLILPAVSSFASFDMMLLPTFGSRVNRYDPVNNLSLGGFNAGVDTRLVSIDQSSGSAFVFDSAVNRTRKYNYNAGTAGPEMFITNIQSMDYHAGTNSVYATAPTEIKIWNQNTTSFVVRTPSIAATWSSGVVHGNFYTALGRTADNFLALATFNCTTNAEVQAVVTNRPLLAGSTIGKAATYSEFGFNSVTSIAFTIRESASNLRMAVFRFFRSVGSEGIVAGSLVTNNVNNFSAATIMPAAVTGHGGFFVVGQDSTTATLTRINEYDSVSTSQFIQTNTIAGTTFQPGPYQVANVVAPEPGSLMALGLGALVLMRRRRDLN